MNVPRRFPFIRISLLIILVTLIVFRLLGEARFSVTPEAIPDFVSYPESPLNQAVSGLLSKSEQGHETLFVPLKGPHLALLARLELALASSKTLDLQYYLFHDDAVGRALLGACIEAAKQGVHVRLLLDDMDTAGREDEFARLSNEYRNLQIRVFNPIYTRAFRPLDFLARFPRSSRRMHNKSLTADNVTTVVGGRNIGDEYFDINAETVFADLDVLAAGAVAKAVTQEFDEYWHSGVAVDITELSEPANDEDYAKWLQAVSKDLTYYQKLREAAGETTVLQLTRGDLNAFYGNGRVIYDKPTKVVSSLFDKSGWLAPKIIETMASAQQELLIVSPYFIPGDNGVELFTTMVARGVDITILTNSAAANDVIAVHAGYMDYRKALLKAGVKLYELKPSSNEESKNKNWSLQGSKNSSLHAKTFIVDRHVNFVGSFNLDPRSAIHNTEMGVVFENEQYSKGASEFIHKQLDVTAYQVTLDDNDSLIWTENNIENGTQQKQQYTTEPGTSVGTKIGLFFMSWLPVEWLL